MTDKKKFRSDIEAEAWKQAEKLSPKIHWEALSKLGVSQSFSGEFVRRWAKLGWIELAEKVGHRKFYRLAGTAEQPEELGNADKTPEAAMWIVMNRYNTFTVKDLAAVGSVGEVEVTKSAARAYCRALVQAGYLKVVQMGVSGKRDTIYRLIKRTGEQAPVMRRVRGIFDPNDSGFVAFIREAS